MSARPVDLSDLSPEDQELLYDLAKLSDVSLGREVKGAAKKPAPEG